MRLSRRVRRLNLIVHVVVSVGWLGLDAVLLLLGATAVLTADPDLMRACVVAMDVAAGALIVPVALLSLGTGILGGLASPYGLVRYRWVLTKLVLTLAAATASIALLRPNLAHAADVAAAGRPLGRLEPDLVIPPAVALTLYLTMTVLSIAKPWGRTRWGRAALTRPRDPVPASA